jgi:hypothetical protein
MPPLSTLILQFLVVGQSTVYLAIIVPIGLLLATRTGLGFPLVKACTSGEQAQAAGRTVATGLLSGVAVGVFAVLIEYLAFFPRIYASLPDLGRPSGSS